MIRRLKRDEQGAAAVEMALALPVLIIFIYGIFQIGMVMAASAGMQHALGEGARLATIYPYPTDATVKTRIENKIFGTYIGNYTVDDPADLKNGAGTTYAKDLRVTYTVTPNFLFFTAPPVTLVRTKRVYLSF